MGSNSKYFVHRKSVLQKKSKWIQFSDILIIYSRVAAYWTIRFE